MIGCLRTRVRNQPIIALYFESENVLKLYNLEASPPQSSKIPRSFTLSWRSVGDLFSIMSSGESATNLRLVSDLSETGQQLIGDWFVLPQFLN